MCEYVLVHARQPVYTRVYTVVTCVNMTMKPQRALPAETTIFPQRDQNQARKTQDELMAY